MKNTMNLIILLVAGLSIQACGNKFEPLQAESSSVGVTTPALEAVESEIAGPSHVALGECSAGITITAKSTPKRPQRVVFPSELTDLIFLDSSCEGRTAAADLTTADLPKTIYFRSEALFQKNISVSIGGQASNSFLLTNYKQKFADVTKSSPGSFVLNSNYNVRQRLFNFYNSDVVGPTSTITNLIFGTRRDTVTQERAIGDEALSTASGADVALFTKSNVYMNGRTIPAVATSIMAPIAGISGNRMSCYSAMNEVYCDYSSPGVATNFQKIALPEGDLQDLEAQVISIACAVKNGRVYCWKNDFIVEEISEFGTNNISVAVVNAGILNQGTVRDILSQRSVICALRDGQVACLNSGEMTDLGLRGVRRIAAGPAVQVLMVQGVKDGVAFNQARDFSTGDVFGFAQAMRFNEFYPLNVRRNLQGARIIQGCGRVEKRLICFEGTPDNVVYTESTETFDLR